MESFLKKLVPKNSRDPVPVLSEFYVSDATPDSVLADDEFTAASITGTLSIPDVEGDGNPNNQSGDLASPQSHILPFEGTQRRSSNVTFVVTSADVMKEHRSSFVLYTILLTSQTGIEKVPTTIERRYSDFDSLHKHLKRKFPEEMENIAFPRKQVVGNFTSETIARRSRAFEQYLCHLFSIFEIRYSVEFAEFFYLADLQEAFRLLLEGNHSESIPLLEKCLPVEEKLYGDSHPKVVLTLCALVVSYRATEATKVAVKYAEAALRCFEDEVIADARYIALLNQTIRLCWSLGRDKTDLEARLQILREKGTDVESAPDLETLVRDLCQQRW